MEIVVELLGELLLEVVFAVIGAACAAFVVALIVGLRAVVGPVVAARGPGTWTLTVLRTGVPTSGPVTRRLFSVRIEDLEPSAFVGRFDAASGIVGPLLLVLVVVAMLLALVELVVLALVLLLVLVTRVVIGRWDVRVVSEAGVESTRTLRGLRSALAEARAVRSSLESDGELPLEWRLPGMGD